MGVTGMEPVIEFLKLITGEILGDMCFFQVVYPGRKLVGGSLKDSREYICMPLFSLLISLAAISGMTLFRAVCTGADQWILDSFQPEWWMKLRGGLIHLLDVYPNVSSMYVYMWCYCKAKARFESMAVRIGGELLNGREDVFGLYLKDEMTNKFVLSEQGRVMSVCLKGVIAVDLFFLAVWNISVGSPIQNIFCFQIKELMPVVLVTALCEAALFLTPEEEKRLRWLFRQRKKKESIESMDLVHIRNQYCSSARQDGVKVKMEYRKHNLGMDKDLIQLMELYETAENPEEQYLNIYLHKQKGNRFFYVNCIDVLHRLVKGENLFLAVPFYRDIDICIFFPMHLALLRGEKTLIFVEDMGDLEEVETWLRKGLESVLDLTGLWNIAVLDKTVADTDVGIMPFQYIHSMEDIIWQRDFFEHVSFAVVIEASDMLNGGQESIQFLASRIGRQTDRCTWLLCDRNAENMLDIFSQLLYRDFHYVSATPYPAKESLIAYWDVESKIPKPWEPVQRYLGIEARIIEVAGREGIEKVVWYGEDSVPVMDLKWIMGQYYSVYGKRTGLKPYQINFNQRVECHIDGNVSVIKTRCFIILEDYCFNLYELGRQYAMRAREQIVVHILSPRYMLRDFMKSQEDIMRADPKYITQLMPEHVNSKRNAALYLTRELLEHELGERLIKEIIDSIELEERMEETRTAVQLRELVGILFDIDNVKIYTKTKPGYLEHGGYIQEERYYKIIDERVRAAYKQYFQQACYMDETNHKKYINRLMLAGHLDQKYLVGQYAVFDGKYYKITGVFEHSNERCILVKRASDQLTRREYYRQKRKYEINKIHSEKTVLRTEKLVLSRCLMDVTAYTEGYVSMDSYVETVCLLSRIK